MSKDQNFIAGNTCKACGEGIQEIKTRVFIREYKSIEFEIPYTRLVCNVCGAATINHAGMLAAHKLIAARKLEIDKNLK